MNTLKSQTFRIVMFLSVLASSSLVLMAGRRWGLTPDRLPRTRWGGSRQPLERSSAQTAALDSPGVRWCSAGAGRSD